jgi:hypothetical protein
MVHVTAAGAVTDYDVAEIADRWPSGLLMKRIVLSSGPGEDLAA